MPTILDEKQNELTAKQDQLMQIWNEATDDGRLDLPDMARIKKIDGSNSAKAAEMKRRNDEMEVLGKEIRELLAVKNEMERSRQWESFLNDPAKAMQHPGMSGDAGAKELQLPAKSLGQMFVESAQYKANRFRTPTSAGNGFVLGEDLDIKTLMTTTAGWAPESLRTGRLVMDAQRPVQIVDVVPSTTTQQAAVVYMEETTFTNSAAEASEGGTYAESALALTEQTSSVRKIATFLPVTDEQLDDVQQVQGYIDNRLPFMLRQRLDLQLLVGDGTPPNLEGINNVTGILTQAKGTDPVFDAVYKAGRQVRVTGRAMPNLVIAHPNDWESIRLTRTPDGLYILGNPAEPGADTLFGWRVIQSDAQTENTMLVGDTSFLELAVRRGVEIQVSNSHSTYFIEGKQAVRADMRVAFIVYRPAAWATVTGV